MHRHRPPDPRDRGTHREMPVQPFEREIEIRSSLRRLEGEERRLQRLGLVRQADGVRRERRYWEFLLALFQLPPLTRSPRG